MNPIIETKALTHIYSQGTPFERVALDAVDFSVNPGEFMGIIGHTGSGKSTLIQHLNGLLKPTSGQVMFDGKDIWGDKQFTRQVRFKVGLVFQYPEYQLFEETVFKDISFGPKNMKLEEDEIRRRVLEAADFVELPESVLEMSPFELSGGQKRRVAIAGVIAMEPDIIVLDEPTAMLDPQGRREVVDTVYSLCRAKGMTVVYITHHMDECIDADRLIIMSNGRVMADGKPESIFANEELLRREGLEQPETARLLQDLRAAGLTLKGEPLNVEDCAELIAQTLQSERSQR